jgi:galactokinase
VTSQLERVSTAFRANTGGHQPAGIWMAPGRVNLIGDHTDYNEGFVLPLAIDRHVVVAVRPRDDDLVRAWSLQIREPALFALSEVSERNRPPGWGAYVAGTAWALRRAGVGVHGFDLVVDGAVTAGAGLASSAAVACATALALAELHDSRLDRPALAHAARRGEVEIVGVPVGVMDQMAAMCCREGAALFLDARSLGVEHVPIDLAEGNLALLVIDVRSPHRLVAGEYASRRADCETASRLLGVRTLRDTSAASIEQGALEPRLRRRARHVVSENQRVLDVVSLLRQHRDHEIGPLLTASHESLRDDYEVSSPELDAAVQAAVGAGALGARMTGAGFGGCAIALVTADQAGDVRRSVVHRFASLSYREPDVFPVTAVGAAHRVA